MKDVKSMGQKHRNRERQRQKKEAQKRINYLRRTYERLREYLETQIETILPITLESPKVQVKKLEDLQSLQVSLMKAEEAFNDTFQPELGEDVDYDALRAQIGRALDRLRAAERSIGVPEEPEQSAD